MVSPARSDDLPAFDQPLQGFFSRYCSDCHSDGADEGGFTTESLSDDLDDPAVFSRWLQVFDRVQQKEMPPADSEQPTEQHHQTFVRLLGSPLYQHHAETKSTVLRRLNRIEYQNTMNDLFGTRLDLIDMLPEDAKADEFDNDGEALGLSMVHLQRYMDAARRVLNASIETRTEPPEIQTKSVYYKDTREAKQFVGKVWKELDDGSVVRFSGGGYPSGMLRGSEPPKPGRYRVTIVAYAYQSEKPITFSVGGTSFLPGSEKPIYGYFSAPPERPTTVEFEVDLKHRYMLTIEPHGISDPKRYQRKTIDEYDGPGLAIGEVRLEGPLIDQFPSKGHQLIYDGWDRREIPPRNPRERTKPWYVPKFELQTDSPAKDAEQTLLRVAQQAFRKPVTKEDIAPYLTLFQKRQQNGDPVDDCLMTAVIGMLCSPQFLYLREPAGELDDHALATRLSYALHRSTPDERLRNLADSGSLTRAETVKREAKRLIADSRFERFIVDFCDSWLDLREMDFTVPDKSLFPEFDPYLRYSMPRETKAFLRQMIEENLPIQNLIRPNFAMLNHRLAELYEIEDVDHVEIRKVSLPPDSLRGGLLSQAAILKVTANGTNTSPVTRGAWVMQRIQGVTPPPPPPGIPGVEPDIRGASTLRELLDKHRDQDNCRACHAKIDPPGFALECFNPIGGYRDFYRSLGEGKRIEKEVGGRRVRYREGPDVDASGQFADGRSFEDFREFRDLLSDNDEMLARTFLKKFLTFATGRQMGFSDRAEIQRILNRWKDREYPITDLIYEAVQSDIFGNK